MRRRVTGVLLVSLLLAVLGVPASAASAPLALTASGAVRGVRAGGVDGFLGIPYAAPPVGAARWRLPRPAAPWPGVRDATAYGPRCSQLQSAETEDEPSTELGSEDCLTVSVRTPAGVPPGRRLPVLVFVHGGGLTGGGADEYDGSQLARAGQVVVTVQYRLGVFGFFGDPALGRGSGGYGFADQQLALRWVQRNAAAFGGDPRRVTIAGESAGAFSVCAHLTAPGSRGLFRAAVLQSGTCGSRSEAATASAYEEAVAAVGCAAAPDVPACLRRVPTRALLDAAEEVAAQFTVGTGLLPTAPRDAVDAGDFARVPVLVGFNQDEGRSLVLEETYGLDRAGYEEAVRQVFTDQADAVLAEYPWPSGPTDGFTAPYVAGQVISDSGRYGVGGCANRRFAATLAGFTRTYAYSFDHREGPGPNPDPQLASFVWGASHAAELPYLWPSYGYRGTPVAPAFGPEEERLARDMTAAWSSFARVGRPLARGLPAWPRHSAGHLTMSLRAGAGSRLITDAELAERHRCDFWDALPEPADPPPPA